MELLSRPSVNTPARFRSGRLVCAVVAGSRHPSARAITARCATKASASAADSAHNSPSSPIDGSATVVGGLGGLPDHSACQRRLPISRHPDLPRSQPILSHVGRCRSGRQTNAGHQRRSITHAGTTLDHGTARRRDSDRRVNRKPQPAAPPRTRSTLCSCGSSTRRTSPQRARSPALRNRHALTVSAAPMRAPRGHDRPGDTHALVTGQWPSRW
jgi:hypothetical protein